MLLKVAVLYGGWSSERPVSLVSGEAVAAGLREAGHPVTLIDLDHDIPGLLRKLTPAPDIVFNALHGPIGEDGHIQGLLDLLRIPYTHSPLLASAVAMDKQVAKSVLRDAGIPVPDGKVVTTESLSAGHPIAPPYVIKPNDGGSSIGVIIIRQTNPPPSREALTGLPATVLVEPFVPGRELTVGILDGEALGVTEITTNGGFYDYEAKYQTGGSEHILPADVPRDIHNACLDLARRAHGALGCRGVSRADFRYDDTKPGTSGLYMLEVNTQPGMTPTSLLPEQAAWRGLSFPDLCDRIIRSALSDRTEPERS